MHLKAGGGVEMHKRGKSISYQGLWLLLLCSTWDGDEDEANVFFQIRRYIFSQLENTFVQLIFFFSQFENIFVPITKCIKPNPSLINRPDCYCYAQEGWRWRKGGKKLENVFVQIPKCICTNLNISLSHFRNVLRQIHPLSRALSATVMLNVGRNKKERWGWYWEQVKFFDIENLMYVGKHPVYTGTRWSPS